MYATLYPMNCPRVALFDLDNTLAEPYQPLGEAIAAAFARLPALLPTAIMSAASLERIQKNVLPGLPKETGEKLTLFTANAGQSFICKDGHWEPQYRFEFSDAQLAKIESSIKEALAETGVTDGVKIYGDQFIDYKGYFAFTALGVGAPVEERRAWDPDFSKRAKLREVIAQKLPEFDVYIGGSTSIDVTLKDVNKSYGIKWLSERLSIPTSEMLYVGDALYKNGNDFVVIQTGIQTRQTSGPEETLSIIEEVLAACRV